jgi:hypothetical protein
MNSRLSEPTVAILSQTSQTIGLFDIVRIIQADDAQCVTWLKPKRGLFEAWVAPHATLAPDPILYTFASEHILGLGSDNLHLTHTGRIQESRLHSASLTRVPYIVQFWEDLDCYPVYTLFPDTFLQWSRTIQSAVYSPRMRSPLASPQISPVAARRRRAVPRELSADAQCAITLEPLLLADAYWTPCGHAFSIALVHALERDKRCPLCRAVCSWEECVTATATATATRPEE